ncbi:MAG: SBBP repeat-containing protein [Chlorobi bacterium]|nr:SBBP repeat-containing protein [Chlorobiota bacterium]
MKKILMFLGVFLVFTTAGFELYSQPIVEWVARFDADDSIDVAKDIVVDNAGNSYVTGYSNTLLGLLTDIVTISYDSDGNVRWRSDYFSLLWDEGAAITLDNTQQYVYITGFINGILGLAGDYIIIKYLASNGQQLWVRTYDNGLLGDDRATSIAVDWQNNPIITGYSSNIILLGTHDYATVKYDQSNGNQLWAARYNNGNEDRAYAIVVDNNNNIIVTGSSGEGGLFGSDDDYATVKYNTNGNQQWASRYDNGGNDSAYAIGYDGSGNVFVTGSSYGNVTGQDYATVKYNSNGNQQWASRYNGSGNGYDRAYAIVVDNNGNPIVTGTSYGGSGTDLDYATVKYNTSNGSQQWASTYSGTGNNEDRAYAIVVDNSGNSYVTGSSRSSSSSDDYATLKYDSNGNQQWPALIYNGTGNNEDRAYAIVVDSPGNIYITGASRSGTLFGSEDYLTIKYSDESNPVTIISNEVPVKCSLYQNYPNPFNPTTNIRFDVPSQSNVKITVFNSLGNQVTVLLNSRLNPGTFEVEWDANNFSSGIYFYRINIGGITETKKMILLK